MANNRFQVRRSSVPGKIPTTSELNIGEIGLNLTDQITYSTNGTVVFEIGANTTNSRVSNTLTVKAISANGANGSSGQVLTTNGTAAYWSTVAGGASSLSILDEGSVLTGTANSINFTGSGVTATTVGNDVTVTISSGGGGGTSIETSIVTGTSQTAVKDYRYILTNVAATTVNLPAAPSLGDTVYVVVANDLLTNIIGRNGLKIMSLDENLTLDYENVSIGLVYANTTLGWRII